MTLEIDDIEKIAGLLVDKMAVRLEERFITRRELPPASVLTTEGFSKWRYTIIALAAAVFGTGTVTVAGIVIPVPNNHAVQNQSSK